MLVMLYLVLFVQVFLLRKARLCKKKYLLYMLCLNYDRQIVYLG